MRVDNGDPRARPSVTQRDEGVDQMSFVTWEDDGGEVFKMKPVSGSVLQAAVAVAPGAAGALTSTQDGALTAVTVATADGSDPTTTQALANALKVAVNALVVDITALRTQYNAAQVDIAALRTKLNVLIAALLTAGITA